MKLVTNPNNSNGDWIVVADYNLTRVDDVRMLVKHAAEKHGLRTILIRHKPTAIDLSLGNRVLDLNPLSETFVEDAYVALRPFKGRIRALLPFSDNAVWSGAKLARMLGLRGDDPKLAEAAFSKSVYRESETGAKSLFQGQNVFVPHYQRIKTLADLEAFAKKCPNGFVLKPSCEGNNRGVIRLSEKDSMPDAFKEVLPYIEGGLIAEELITFKEEFSYDGIGDLNWITQKLSVHGRYPVEYGQVVGVSFDKNVAKSIRSAGRLANWIVGQHIGPFHNEVKMDRESGQSAVIEPNRRPAGMKIWHLAERVYGINFFHTWIDQLVTGDVPSALPAPKGIAAIRELPSPKSGWSRMSQSPEFARVLFEEIKAGLAKQGLSNLQWSEFRITAKEGTWVETEPRDNAGFVGEVCLYSPDGNIDVEEVLQQFENEWKRCVSPFIEESSYENTRTA